MTPQEAYQKASQYLKKLLLKNSSCPILEGKIREPSSPLTRAVAIGVLDAPVEYMVKNLHRYFIKLDTLADIIRQDNTQPPDFLLPPYGQEEQNPIDQKLGELDFTVYQRGALNIPTILDKLADEIACGNFPRDGDSPAKLGKKGGGRGKVNEALQTAINRIVQDLGKTRIKPTVGTVKTWIREKTFDRKTQKPRRDPTTRELIRYSFEPIIPNCDELMIDGPKLVWKDRDGREQSIAFSSLRRYIDRAKDR